jgi:hypothetical protein
MTKRKSSLDDHACGLIKRICLTGECKVTIDEVIKGKLFSNYALTSSPVSC